MIANLSLFTGRLFSENPKPASVETIDVHEVEVLKAVGEAEELLRSALGEGGDLLSPTAWKDLCGGLAKFLDDLQLLHANPAYIQEVVRPWVASQHEMLSRLRSDRESVSAWLSSECGLVTSVETDLSDRHDGGRTVAIFTFSSGVRVVYKPREMGIEDWYSRFVGWLGHSRMPSFIKAARVLTRPGYGWMEFVPHRRCATSEELGHYYRNAGALLCVLHLLRARDCHFQNLIADGEFPVLVDAEMLFQPQLTEREPIGVMQTGMIPSFRFGPEGQHYDVSGLGFVEPKTTHFRVPERTASGVRYRLGVLEPRHNVPFTKDQAVRPEQFVAEIVDGFTEVYRFLVDHREDLFEWIRSAAKLPVRYLIRETMDYYEALRLDLSQEGRVSVVLPPLAPTRSIFSELQGQEIASLERLDIPHFILAADERSLCGLDDCFHRSGLELALTGVEELSEQDLAKQVQSINLSWSLSRLSGSMK